MTQFQERHNNFTFAAKSQSQKFHNLLKTIGPGLTTATAYDTAWAARLHAVTPELAQSAIKWLRTHQLSDGSWGMGEFVYHHERVICTLIAIIALAENGCCEDTDRIQEGAASIDHHLAHLVNDKSGETIAFEMLFPTLMVRAKQLGIMPRGKTTFFNSMHKTRAYKIARSPGNMISRYVTMSFSAEMAGEDGVHLLDVGNLQETNGSVGYSPSATAYYLLHIDPQNVDAQKYLERTFIDGGLPNVATIDIFERAWSLWNLAITDSHSEQLWQAAQPHLDYLEDAWVPGKGAGTAIDWTLKDGDGTSIVYEVLKRYGRSVDLDGLLHYETDTHFRTFQLESNVSTSTNIHAYGALRHARLHETHPSVQKIADYLKTSQTAQGYWVDKWHASPYYPTTHLIIASAGYQDHLVTKAIDWIYNTQRPDGSWGYYVSTAEETAYCLQALSIWQAAGHYVPSIAIRKGYHWLNNHMHQPFTPLWIGKCLYTPLLVVQSTIISALMLAERSINMTLSN
ncbi:MAG: cyclase [Chloroflexi bacterium]|nr:MAG: cyclase [Chloroflexota bacterium]